MSIPDFVCYVLNVPVSLSGYSYVCKAIEYVLNNDGETRFYEHLQKVCNKNFSCIEKSLRLVKNKSLNRMLGEDYEAIFGRLDKSEVKVKDFICYAAVYYRKEYMNENKAE